MKLFLRFCIRPLAITIFIFSIFIFFQQQVPKNLSLLTSKNFFKEKSKKSIHGLFTPSIACSKNPAPLYLLSEQEKQQFPGASVIQASEVDGPNLGEKTRIRILKTDLKYPYIRTEEVVNTTSGMLVRRSEMVADHLLVRLPAGENPEHFLNELDSDATGLERITNKDSLYRLQLASHDVATFTRVSSELQQKQISNLSVEPDYVTHALVTPNNPLYNQQWYLHQRAWHIDGPWDYRIFFSGIDACDAWQIRTSAEDIIVAVIDSGIRYTHEDLAANMWHQEDPVYGTIYGWNFSVQQGDPKESDPMDEFGHGTACAGIIGALGNSGVGTVGVAWRVKLMALKYYDQPGTGVISDAVKAIDFACEHGASILNCSWMSDGGESGVLCDAIYRAQNQGVIVVAAAGNSGENSDEHPIYPANYAHGYGLDNVISVAATAEDSQLAEFSNFGPTTVDIAAPGEEIFSTWARTDSDYLTAETREEILNLGDDAGLNKGPCGTSLSAPQVVGALALLKAQSPTSTYQQLIHHIIDTSDPIFGTAEKKIIGGRLNLAKALENMIL